MNSRKRGFTLVELLVVMAILGILATIALVSFRSSQIKARDAKRKADLRQIASALELYFNDHGKYPDDAGGAIVSCGVDGDQPCVWGDPNGAGEFRDDRGTIYMKVLAVDPTSGSNNYVYRTSADGSQFQLFAALENPDDPFIKALQSQGGSISQNCGVPCNFGVTSPNTSVTESI